MPLLCSRLHQPLPLHHPLVSYGLVIVSLKGMIVVQIDGKDNRAAGEPRSGLARLEQPPKPVKTGSASNRFDKVAFCVDHECRNISSRVSGAAGESENNSLLSRYYN